MKKALTIMLILIFSLALIPLAFSGAKKEELKVGTLMAHTGDLKEFGDNIRKGIALAAMQLGDAGLTIKLYEEDSETSPIPGVNAARKLVNINQVGAIIGGLSSGGSIAGAESVTIPNNVIQISPASTSPLLSILPADQGKDFLFRTTPSDALQGVVSGTEAAKLVKTASILYTNNAYGQGLAQEFTKAFEANGGKVLASVPHEQGQPSYAAELKKALAGNPQTIAAFSYPVSAVVYIKEAIELYNFKNFFYCDGTKSIDMIEALGADVLEGQMGTAAGSKGGKAKDLFVAAFEDEFGDLPPLPYIDNGYDAMAVLGLAALAAKAKGLELTATNIRDNLREIAAPPGAVILPGEFKKAADLLKKGQKINYEGASGSTDFDQYGDVITPIEVWKFTNGTIERVKLVEVE
ncbi:MAG TPA: amino acid ABC transporter substrate-binding protein [bacterium]|nr:amino acid ABC transporter substrate-binding protein [bacterium]